MDINELNSEFNLRYNEITNNEGSGFSPKEKSILLTYAQDLVLKDYYPKGNKDKLVQILLQPLQVTSTITSTSAGVYPNGYIFNLPKDHKYTIEEFCKVVFNSNAVCETAGTERNIYDFKLITGDYYAKNINNPMKKPYKMLIWQIGRYNNTNAVELIGDNTFDLTEYTIVYYKGAKPIIIPDSSYTAGSGKLHGYSLGSYTTGLSSEVDGLHSEIIGKAIELGTTANKDQLRFQLQTMENKLNSNLN